MSDAVRPGPLEGALVWEEDVDNGTHEAEGVPGEYYCLVPHLDGKLLVKHLEPLLGSQDRFDQAPSAGLSRSRTKFLMKHRDQIVAPSPGQPQGGGHHKKGVLG